MALKKESNSLGNENEKSQNENASLIELKNLEENKESNSLDNEQERSKNEDNSQLELNNLENKKEIKSQPLEVSKGNDIENGFLDFGFNQSILKSLKNKGYKIQLPSKKLQFPN